MLKSGLMHLSHAERRWLPWFGKTGKLAMGWACYVNRRRYPVLEQTFEGIAATRVKILTVWAEQQWAFLEGLAEEVVRDFPRIDAAALQSKRALAKDFSELFVVAADGRVIVSTHAQRNGVADLPPRALAMGLKQRFLHGPYTDPATLLIGPSSSRFHDQVTLMFYHTELELMFTDPATGRLHPGVRETIRNGNNLYVTYPGYSDYRHIPVIGKGVTFRMPGSLDTWGMMCEADLEEAYRFRSVNYRMMGIYLWVGLGIWGAGVAGERLLDWPQEAVDALHLGLLLAGAVLFYRRGLNPMTQRLRVMARLIRSLAEGGGNLAQRFERSEAAVDEPSVMAQWVNSFIDNLDGTVSRVILAAEEMQDNHADMLGRNQEASTATGQVLDAVQDILESLSKQMADIDSATETTAEIRSAMHQAVESARHQFALVQQRTQGIRVSIEESSQTIHRLGESTNQIGKIVMQEILERMFALIQEIAQSAYSYGDRVRGVAHVTESMRSALDELNFSVAQARQTSEKLRRLAGQFQVTQMQGNPAF